MPAKLFFPIAPKAYIMAPARAPKSPLLRHTLVALGSILTLLAVAGSPDAGASGLLTNGGFEQGTDGWAVNAGQIDVVDSPVQNGSHAARFSGTGQPTTQYLSQWVSVQPDEDYQASGWVAAMASGASRVFLRLSWHDAGGRLLSQSDSAWLHQFDGTFHRLTTGAGLSPSAARLARFTAIVQADAAFTIHLDTFEFLGPPAPPAETPPAPPTASPATPAPTSLPVATLTPKPPTATPRPTSRPSATRTPRASPVQPPGTETTPSVTEPSFFEALVNGGFEELRIDGTPFGWHKQGGELLSALDHLSEGNRSLSLASTTGSTKWAYQTVTVVGGSYYQAAVDARAGEGVESAFLRLSWYRSGDGSGPAISSVDSTEDATASGIFKRVSTGAVQAPAEAASAKVRLMVRPVSEQPGVAHFDAAAFAAAKPGDPPLVFASTRERSDVGQLTSGQPPAADDDTATQRQPIGLVNVKPPETADNGFVARTGSGDHYWAIALAVGVAATALAIAGAFEYFQRRRQAADPPQE